MLVLSFFKNRFVKLNFLLLKYTFKFEKASYLSIKTYI